MRIFFERFQCIRNSAKTFNVLMGVISTVTLRRGYNSIQVISQMIIEGWYWKVCESLCLVNFPEEWWHFPLKNVFIMEIFILLFTTESLKKYIANYRTICTGQHDLARMFWLIKLTSLRQKS